MEEARVVFTFAQPGTLAADWTFSFKLPWAFMPRKVSLCGSNANDATVKIGTSSDDDALMVAKAVGDSGTPNEYDADDFADIDYQFTKGATVLISVDYNGAAGTAVQDLVMVISGLSGA